MFLSAFIKALLLITSAEIGDKSFLITMFLAMRYPRRWVFLGTVLALAIMTVLSVVVGKLFMFFDFKYLHYLEVVYFYFLGLNFSKNTRKCLHKMRVVN